MTVILFELHHMGDSVLSIPFVRAMTGKNLHVVCRGGSVPIFHKFLPLNNIHIWEPWWELPAAKIHSSLSELFRLLKVLRGLRCDLALCVWADSRVHWLMRQTGTKTTFGFPVNRRNFYAHERPWRRRRMRIGQILGLLSPLSHPIQRRGYQQSHLDDWQQLTEAAGLLWDTEVPWFDVKPASDAAQLRNPNRKIWLIHPGGRLPTKRWPIERFQALLQTRFLDSSCILISPPDSNSLVPAGKNQIAVRTQSFEELLSWIAAADAVLCNDSLVSHLAAALGKPVWTIFGSGNPNWFAPFQNVQRVIACDVCSFRPCVDRCVHLSPICLESVTVDQVSTAVPLTDNFS